MNEIAWVTAGIFIAGLLGCFLPFLPGPPLVWLGALYYAWRTDYATVGWPMLIFLLLLALLGASADWWMSFFGAKKSGASLWASLASLLGGLIGLFVFSLPGMIIGALAAMAAVEYSRHGDWSTVLRAGSGYLIGYLLGTVVQIGVALAMIVIFVLDARF